jgi:hypothetical protein
MQFLLARAQRGIGLGRWLGDDAGLENLLQDEVVAIW